MVKVTFLSNKDGSNAGITIKGHAGYNKPCKTCVVAKNSGTDIICSAVSALAVTLINSLIACDFGCNYNADDGEVELFINSPDSTTSKTMLDTMFFMVRTGFEGLAEQYPAYVKVFDAQV